MSSMLWKNLQRLTEDLMLLTLAMLTGSIGSKSQSPAQFYQVHSSRKHELPRRKSTKCSSKIVDMYRTVVSDSNFLSDRCSVVLMLMLIWHYRFIDAGGPADGVQMGSRLFVEGHVCCKDLCWNRR